MATPLRRISPRIPASVYVEVQRFAQRHDRSLRAIVSDALNCALENAIEIPRLPPETAEENTAVVARVDPELVRRAKVYCVAHDVTLREFVSAALTSLVATSGKP